MRQPLVWSDERFRSDSLKAIDEFRDLRFEEPPEIYRVHYARYRTAVAKLLTESADLTQLDEHALDLLADPDLAYALRYLSSPPISEDDLALLANTTLPVRTKKPDPQEGHRIIEIVMLGLDRERFPWLPQRRRPTASERNAAIIATAALIATQRTQTDRRNQAKQLQEELVTNALIKFGLAQVTTRRINTVNDGPKPGTFCRESVVAERKADIIVGLYDHRLMPIECKVSNSFTNSVKRLNNDAAEKAVIWKRELGERGVVPAAVLAGAFKLINLKQAQHSGLAIYWSHSLGELFTFIYSTHDA